MKKIICPTDFSPTANNAVEYAAKFAQIMKAEFEILHFQILSGALPIVSSIKAVENIAAMSASLQKMCDEVKHTYDIPCIYSLEATLKTLEKAISGKSEEQNLIVMGTNGTDDQYQYIFGTNSYHVIRKSKCPVLIIPEGVRYSTIKKVVFAWDYSNDNKISLMQLNDLLGDFDPEIIFLHISTHISKISDDVFNTWKDDIQFYLGEKKNNTFERIYSPDPESIPQSIDEYMLDSKADLLAITYYDRGALRNVFHGTVAKGLSEMAEYPLLTLHV